MDFMWFEDKRLTTLGKHGLDFRDAHHLFDGRALYSYPSPREGKVRFVSVGIIDVASLPWFEWSQMRHGASFP